MPRRIESPSSILTHRHCPRKYFYHYIEKKPTTANVHTVKGNLVHEVLDAFFAHPPLLAEQTYMEQCVIHLRTVFDAKWQEKKHEFASVGATPTHALYVETLSMISLWLEHFLLRITSLSCSVQEAFILLTPQREQKFMSEQHSVMGYVDVIEQHQGKVRVMDYKTSARPEMTDEYKLQLAIYALLYSTAHGKPPDEVGIYFLKHPKQFEQIFPVTEELLKEAQFIIETHHLSTVSDKMHDYPQKIGHWCKWSTGQCDFYNLCFPAQRKLQNW